MGESNELYSTVNYIKHKVEAIEKIELLNLRSNKDLRNEYISTLQQDSLLFKVYKEIDGVKSQKDISISLDTSQMNVTNRIKKLHEIGLIEIKDVTSKNERIYMHSVAEQAFKLTKERI